MTLPSSVHAALCVAAEQRQAFLYLYISVLVEISQYNILQNLYIRTTVFHQHAVSAQRPLIRRPPDQLFGIHYIRTHGQTLSIECPSSR